jgi:hypothetical protein
MNRIILPSLLLLAACSTTSQPGIEVRTVEVPVIELVACLAPEDIPAQPGDLERPLPVDARNLAVVLTQKLLEWRQYGVEANAAMERCSVLSD